jgi:hypothetical protein
LPQCLLPETEARVIAPRSCQRNSYYGAIETTRLSWKRFKTGEKHIGDKTLMLQFNAKVEIR